MKSDKISEIETKFLEEEDLMDTYFKVKRFNQTKLRKLCSLLDDTKSRIRNLENSIFYNEGKNLDLEYPLHEPIDAKINKKLLKELNAEKEAIKNRIVDFVYNDINNIGSFTITNSTNGCVIEDINKETDKE